MEPKSQAIPHPPTKDRFRRIGGEKFKLKIFFSIRFFIPLEYQYTKYSMYLLSDSD